MYFSYSNSVNVSIIPQTTRRLFTREEREEEIEQNIGGSKGDVEGEGMQPLPPLPFDVIKLNEKIIKNVKTEKKKRKEK